MVIADQVCTRTQGKRLVELGVDLLNSEFSHVWLPDDPAKQSNGWFGIMHKDHKYAEFAEVLAPAFTVAELGVMLPTAPYPDSGHSYNWYHRNHWKGHSVGYNVPMNAVPAIQQQWFKYEAEARADMLIHLLEIGVTSGAQVNEKLNKC